MTALELLHGPLGSTIGWTLVHLVWQATIVAILLGAVRALWPAASAEARYFTALAALLAVVALPVLTFLHLGAGEPSFVPAVTNTLSVPAAEAGAVSTLSESVNPPLLAGIETFVSSRLPWFVGFWVVGVHLLGVRLVLRTARTARLTRDGLTEVEGSWRRAVDRLRKKLALTRAVRLYESALVRVPTVVGWLQPVVLMPASVFLGLSYRQIEAILAHELAHVRRHDALVNLLQSVVETFFFYHPAVWWISGRIRIEREHCCDDMALRVCRDRVAFARALAFLEETRAEMHQGALAASGGSLLRRIRRIAGVEERARKTPSIAALIILLMLGAATAWAFASPDREIAPDEEVAVRAHESGNNLPTRPAPAPPQPEEAPSSWSWIIEIDDDAFAAPIPPPPPLPPLPRVPPLAPVPAPAPPYPPAPPAPHDARFTFELERPPAPPVPPLPPAPAPAPPDPPAPPTPHDARFTFELERPPAPPVPPPPPAPAPAPPDPPAPPWVHAGVSPSAPAPAPRGRSRTRGGSDRRMSEDLTVDDPSSR
jgi:beta-lactamase regulating signal transducer with metallopeptidase domain